MTVLAVQRQGQGVVSADALNAYTMTAATASILRAVTGLTGMAAYLQGISAPQDGGQGFFYWNGTATGPDDNFTVIMPQGQIAGAWVRLSFDAPRVVPYSLQTPSTGFSISIPNGVGQLLLAPSGTLATGAITFPSQPVDGQIIGISSSQIVTALTLLGFAGQFVSNPVSALAAGIGVNYQYVLSNSTWYRV